MARKTASKSVCGTALVDKTNGLGPPPSTIAAQIVENHSLAEGCREPKSRAAFGQLLDEIRACPSDVECNVQSNYRLISVLAEAGLDALAKQDPFAPRNEIITQAIASLEVIEVATRRSPDVLFYDGPGTNGQGSQVCLWLLPKLFSVIACKEYSHIQASLQRLLQSFLDTLARSPERWVEVAMLVQLYQTCTDDLLSALEVYDARTVSETPFEVIIPSADARGLLCHGLQQPVALPTGCQTHIRRTGHAVIIVQSLLSSLLGFLDSPGIKKYCSISVVSSNQSWILKSLGRLWHIIWSAYAESRVSERSRGTLTSHLRILHEFTHLVLENGGSTAIYHKTGFLLIQCMSRIMTLPLSTLDSEAQRYIAKNITSLLRFAIKSSYVMQEVSQELSAKFKELKSIGEHWKDLSRDLQNVIDQILCCLCLSAPSKQPSVTKSRFGRQCLTLATQDISNMFSDLDFRPTENNAAKYNRSPKRQKLEHVIDSSCSGSGQSSLLETLCSLLGKWDINQISNLATVADGLFINLPDEEKRQTLKILASLPCSYADPSRVTRARDKVYLYCEYCDRDSGKLTSRITSTCDENHSKWIHNILAALMDSVVTQTSKEFKILSMIAVKTLTAHTSISEHLDLAISTMGNHCLQGLRSSCRELRIAAAQVLPNFLQADAVRGDNMCRKNRVVALEFLKKLSDLDDSRHHETVILALGQVASVCGEEEMNFIFLRLIEYLGHTNSFTCGVASLELRRIAHMSGVSIEELLRPYWRIIGITVVKDLQRRPQRAQQLSDLLGLSVNQLLVLTQAETLPYLVLWKRQDILQRIAGARGPDATIWSMCMQPRNFTAIISLLLVQQPANFEATVRETLGQFNREYKHEEIVEILKNDPISLACEVLKAAGDEEGTGKARVLEGLQELAFTVERRGHQTKTANMLDRTTAIFFELHALGIMASFSDVIESPNYPPVTKKRCLRGIEEMIRIARGNIIIAVPQIRACLHTAMEVSELCDHAFSAWTVLLTVLEADEDLESLIDHTFTAIVQNWEAFAPKTQQKAHDAIAALLKNHSALILRTVYSIPSLVSIPLMSKFDSQLSRLKSQMDTSHCLQAFSRRCQDENANVVLQALRELLLYLGAHQQWIHETAVTEQPSKSISELSRSLLDTSSRFTENQVGIPGLCARCLGIIGCLDPSRVETIREKRELIVLSNFDEGTEAVQFVAFFLEHVLVKAFHSVSNPRAQGFLAYVMQELLKFCGFNKEATHPYRPQGSQADDVYQRWVKMPESIRGTLTPFLSSRYILTTQTAKSHGLQTYPIYSPALSYGTWLRDFACDLLQKSSGDNAQRIFTVLSRIIRGYDVSIASFLLPFAATNVIISGTEIDATKVGQELLTVLKQSTRDLSQGQIDILKLCSENVFHVLDYLLRWLQEKKKRSAAARSIAARSGRGGIELEDTTDTTQIKKVEQVLAIIPANVISRRAVECGSYARALFHWEQYIRQQKDIKSGENRAQNTEALYQRLQDIYVQIDEPDGVEGISAHLHILSPSQQVLEHRRAGRWVAAQSWYELQLVDQPDSLDLHTDLLACLQECGQYHVILDHVKSLHILPQTSMRILSIVSEAAWCTERWEDLERFLPRPSDPLPTDFNAALGAAMVALRGRKVEEFAAIIKTLRGGVAKTLSIPATASLQACRSQLLKLHALYEVEVISGSLGTGAEDKAVLVASLDRRLNVIGSYLPDKQYLLGLRRAAMRLSSINFTAGDIAASWMASSKLARKGDSTSLAYDAVIHASQLGDESAKMEHARLLWKDGEHRKAIQSLEGAIATNAFDMQTDTVMTDNASFASHSTTATTSDKQQQNLLVARAHLLLAKWLDQAGQTQSKIINAKYQFAQKSFSRWEKGLYYLGKYYNKLLEWEKALPSARQNQSFLSGDNSKLVIENYLRSLMFGCKYLFETLPRLLTLWLEFGIEVNRTIGSEVPEDIRRRSMDMRPKMMDTINKQVRKYVDKIPSYLFYTAISQMVTRICHPNQKVYDILASIIVKVVGAHPQQALWPLLAVVKSSTSDRASRGISLLHKLKDRGKNIRNEGQSVELRSLVTQGQKMSDQLLHVCEASVEGRTSNVSLTKDLGFKNQVAPCPLVIPLEKTLSASLPTTTDHVQMRSHKAFPMSRDAITISSFSDDVLILNSLQKPRKLTVRGSDGGRYGLLCKPNDDLRKDQRLMEFNAMINRSLKKDAESSKRRLYIKGYAVTPLNEACGLIEWVDGLKPMRDILLNLYKQKNIKVDYGLLRELLNEACAHPDSQRIFTDTILPMYPPVLHEWFTELFPEPETWFAARLRYTRSCAVASMVGHALGLGDRHGENVLLEEVAGGVFHVDFNCLFDKGLTFEKPELVPFRLTHNMVDAFGAYGVEGPFRRSAEQAMKVMRGNEDALLTILETFVYDPTADFVGPSRKKSTRGVPETPKEVLESVRSKVRGLLRGESVPLSVGGHVDALIRQATAAENLCAMYIGWCAFL